METLRKPFFVAALILATLVVLAEIGASFGIRGKATNSNAMQDTLLQIKGMEGHQSDLKSESFQKTGAGRKSPGAGILSMAAVDLLMLFTGCLMAAQFLLGERLQGRLQGIMTLIVGLLALIGAVIMIIIYIIKLLVMVALFLAIPFGTLAYLAVWGSFNVGAAKAVLGLLLLLKLCFPICLVLAHQRFLQNKGLLLIILTSLLANLIVSFLHAIVPSFLVSITDTIAAIIVLVLGAVWAVFFLIGSIGSVFKALN